MSLAGIDSLEQDTPIELFQIDQFNLANLTEAFYFTNNVGVSFEGIQYQAIGCTAEGYDLIGQGSIPTPILTVSNVGNVVSTLLRRMIETPGYRLEGARITRIVTSKKFLDGQSNANDAIKQDPPDIYVLEQIQERTYQAVKIGQSTPFDLEGDTLPNRIALRSCGSVYRSQECSYLGSNMYTIGGELTLDKTKDVCAKSIKACQLRFGSTSVLPYGGFVGLGGSRQ